MELYNIHIALYPLDRHLPHSTHTHIYLPFPATTDDAMLTLMWPRRNSVCVIEMTKIEDTAINDEIFYSVLENITWSVETLQHKQQDLHLLEKCRRAGREMIEWEERRQRRDTII